MSTEEQSRVGWRRRLALAALVSLGAVYASGLWVSKVGLYHDDGVYVETAKSVAEGRGYRISGHPGEIRQTKYPPVWPLALAAGWRIWPEFPSNQRLLKGIAALALAAWVALCLRTFQDVGKGATSNWGLWALVLVLASPMGLVNGTALMSEAAYGALALGALTMVGGACRREGAWGAVALAGLLAGLAYLTRTAGIVLLPAGAVVLLAKRRYRQAALYAAIAGIAVVAWAGWQHGEAAPATQIERYYTATGYQDLITIGSGKAAAAGLRVAGQNALTILLYPAREVLQVARTGAVWLVLETVLSCLFWWLVVRGGLRASPEAWPALVWALLTMAMSLIYAWTPTRFLLPVLPVLIACACRGLDGRWARLGVPMACVLPMVGALLFAWHGQERGLNEFRTTACLANSGDSAGRANWGQTTKVYDWVRQNTPPDAVILTVYDPALSLYTGRMAVRPVAGWGLELFFGAQRPLPEKVVGLTSVSGRYHAQYLVTLAQDAGMEPDYAAMLSLLEKAGTLKAVQKFGEGYAVYEFGAVPK